MGKDREPNARNLAGMIKDLKKIKAEMLPGDEADEARQEEMKSFDKWQKQKHELNALLKSIRVESKKLEDRKKELGDNTRDQIVIRLMSDNQKQLKTAGTLWGDMKATLNDDIKKRAKKLGDKELDDRKKTTQLLGQELVDLSNKNTRVKGSGAQTAEELADQAEASDPTRARSRTQQKRQERLDRQKKRATKRRGNKEGHMELDDDDIIPTEMGQQEQQWMDQVEANKAEQDEILDTILDGLEELKELSLDMNKNLELQNHMATELSDKMDKTIEQYKNVNSRLTDLLDKSGGLSRWCPTLICFIILLACCGYIYKLAS